jgi:hypothetical protein
MENTQSSVKTQPWKSHWPPAPKATAGVEYGVEKGNVVVVDGTSAKVSAPRQSDEGIPDTQEVNHDYHKE